MLKIYRLIMDPNVNPLRDLPIVQQYQIMVSLSMMWSAIFCTAVGAWLWYGHLVVGHILVLLGFLITALTFRSARKASVDARNIYRNHPQPDGTARYDDVWGA